MDVYKGTGAFSGIAIGKILYYHKSEYQMRQYEITDVKTELNIFRQARARVMEHNSGNPGRDFSQTEESAGGKKLSTCH